MNRDNHSILWALIRKSLYLLLSLGIFLPTMADADPNPPVVLDALNVSTLPKNFRTTDDVANLPEAFVEQLRPLQACGSAQFSKAQLKKVFTKIPLPMAIIDLRQEAHGFVNGHAISWYGLHNWDNVYRTPEEIERNQADKLNALTQGQKATINILTKFSDDALKLSPFEINASDVLSEAQLAEQYHLLYLRLYIADGQQPNNQQVDRFIQFVKTMPKQTTLYFHCRAGLGRTTMLMAMYDMMRNANRASFQHIMQRQFLMGGKNLLVLPHKNSYKYPFAVDRKIFLMQFYRYCREQAASQFKIHWSDWQRMHGDLVPREL